MSVRQADVSLWIKELRGKYKARYTGHKPTETILLVLWVMLGNYMVAKRNKGAESRARTQGTAGRGSGDGDSSPKKQ